MDQKIKSSPQRKCVGCGEMKDKKSLLRVVKQPDGTIIIDKTGKKNGRGAYVCANLDCFNKAKKAKRFEKSFKCQIGAEIYLELEKQI